MSHRCSQLSFRLVCPIGPATCVSKLKSDSRRRGRRHLHVNSERNIRGHDGSIAAAGVTPAVTAVVPAHVVLDAMTTDGLRGGRNGRDTERQKAFTVLVIRGMLYPSPNN